MVAKLGFRPEGLRPRYLHIDGAWRDHLSYALTVEELPEGLLTRWRALGGADGVLGRALTDESDTRNGGRYNFFEHGSIFWTSATGAQAVFGGMRDGWARTGAEWGFLGFPTSGEVGTAGRPGAVQLFQGGSLYWSAATGANPVGGVMMGAWARQGYEGGRLGFPRTGEFDSPDGRKQEFQGGNIVWTPQRGAVIAYR